MNVILIMIDSLNRTYISPYGTNIKTPNFERLAKRSLIIDNHWTGSLPTMPSRHEIMAGRYEYLWRGWGPLEPFDITIPQLCKKQSQVSMLITDTYHYFQEGSGNYHTDFTGWEFLRGHERDSWITDPIKEPPRIYKKMIKERPDFGPVYMRNTYRFRDERDFFSPRLFTRAAEWLDSNHTHKNFFLMIDSFDVHEPFHVPPPYDTMYDPDFSDDWSIWNNYGFTKDFDPKVLDHIRAQYKGKITMLDKWIGTVFDRLGRYNLWDTSLVIVTSDHGHHFGENGWVGKNRPPYYRHLTNIPLFISFPKMKPKSGRHYKILTSQIDLYPTIIEALGLKIPKDYTIHGYSLFPFLKGESKKIRNIAHTGYFGSSVVITDGRYTLHKMPADKNNQPLYQYGIRLEHFHKRFFQPYIHGKTGRFLPYTECIVFKNPLKKDLLVEKSDVPGDMLFDLNVGEDFSQNIISKFPHITRKLTKRLVNEFKRIQVPQEQYERLGLNEYF